MAGCGVEKSLEGFFGAGHQDKVVGVGQAGDEGIVVAEGLVLWEGVGFLLHRAEDNFDTKVEQDRTQRAALFYARQDRDGIRWFRVGSDRR